MVRRRPTKLVGGESRLISILYNQRQRLANDTWSAARQALILYSWRMRSIDDVYMTGDILETVAQQARITIVITIR
jgi:hypothetical protein